MSFRGFLCLINYRFCSLLYDMYNIHTYIADESNHERGACNTTYLNFFFLKKKAEKPESAVGNSTPGRESPIHPIPRYTRIT